jgi:hypothetical protein
MYNDLSKESYLISISSSKHYLVLFIIWPFLAFLMALANYSQKEAKKVVYFFLIYYGLTFVNNNESVDAFRYAIDLKENAALPFSDFFKIVGGLYSTDTSVDIVEPFISFVISRFTSNHSIYFAVWAAIFGFFYLRSINLLYERYRVNPGWNTVILMVFFITVLPITSISGVRMWTAAWIFFYGAYHVVLYRESRFLFLALASVFVHWSFISANAILIIYYLAGNRNIIYLPLTIVSFFLPRLIEPLLQNLSMRLGGGLQNRVNNYSSEEYIIAIQEGAEQAAWFMKIAGQLVYYYLIIALVIVKVRFGSLMKDKEERNLYSFILLYLAFVNFGISIPSFGERFQILFVLFATLYLFLFYVKLPGTKISFIVLAGLFPMLLSSLITFRIGSESISAWLFTPGLGSPLISSVVSLSEMIF